MKMKRKYKIINNNYKKVKVIKPYWDLKKGYMIMFTMKKMTEMKNSLQLIKFWRKMTKNKFKNKNKSQIFAI